MIKDREFFSAAYLIAQTSASREAPGVARDELTDQLIDLARQWLAANEQKPKNEKI